MERKKQIKTILVALLLVGSILGFGYGMSTAIKPSNAQSAPASAVSEPPMIPANFTDLARVVRPGVVNIQVVKKVKNVGFGFHSFGGPFGDKNPFGDFFGPFFEGNPPRSFEQRGVGSGFVMNRDGYILTNNHVVEDADQIKVKLANGKEYDGKVVGRDPKTDLALVKINGATDLHPLQMGNSDDIKVGSWVVAVGSPFGLEQTVTAGIVSAKGRVIGSGPYDDFIQTDASINPGNSGGPLVDMKGQVIGVNTAIISEGKGIGFAIPINMAKEVVPQLEEKGHVTRGWLGVSIQEVTPGLAKSFGLKEGKGALVAQVVSGSPAEKAGIEQGDVIVQFDGKDVASSKDLPRIVASTPVGKEVTIKLSRDGKVLDRQVKVGEMEEKAEVGKAPSTKKSLGLTVQDLTPEIAKGLGLKKETGVVVTGVEPGSPAADAGIRSGDVIREVNRKPVKDVQDFIQKVEKAKDQDNVLLFLQRGQNNMFAAVTVK
ncbi:MAG TPA: DegQ family serine endoprotease [Thermodesulfobacteriota bacterium]|nr:DegQ family serine endoprotease [Thermodesulfobacteriota bacterium]